MNKYIGKDLIWESNNVKLLGITIDRDLKFEKHVLKLCSIAQVLFLKWRNCFLSIKKDTF